MTPPRLFALCLVLGPHTALAFTNNLQQQHSLHQKRRNDVFLHALMASNNLHDANYKQILFADSYDKAVLVDACALWCGPCKLIEPILNKCAEKWQDSLYFVKYDVEASANPNLKLELLLQNAMPRSLPCLLLFRKGKVVMKHSGVITEEELDGLLEKHLGRLVTAPSTKRNKGAAGFVSMSRDDSADDYMLSRTI